MTQFMLKLGLFVAIAAISTGVWACPVCDSAVGREVRAGIFNDGFAVNMLIMALPFVALAAIVGLLQVVLGWLERPSVAEIIFEGFHLADELDEEPSYALVVQQGAVA